MLFTSHLYKAYKAIDAKRGVTAVLMLDLSKAVDNINRQKLLVKLRSLRCGSSMVRQLSDR